MSINGWEWGYARKAFLEECLLQRELRDLETSNAKDNAKAQILRYESSRRLRELVDQMVEIASEQLK